ncbi:MAG: acyl-ACP--UDP-N-acetylglucosamine O-acyltransferase [Alphaproteobacteria bacterium]|nr:acyl-ACP--UDP-N-acetylglucosamine O-acyltransferase [Alphaproteobacteria bacterium]MBU2042707.1 acyl-ACP--UDP-N-acetylglucosamine O-acyltransferase [Alphaproteobacteria bacterium]MBU2126170.1 acyl-ACP--UDP-N-acetylglucosamine O-acyltransferase [Alphaproteobacteria bacterium]MBU2208890.1 acyl-ACP--UDP-N-acetylglucosamine O-acyltransferase [Alphaproteobacteria bacterium]MBU2290379.1 acyl-ACP--UDP-N-acetylglucosamine O-acyltransferase [Alphaproteobacteria bacterium]
MSRIHPTAQVDGGAVLGDGVEIGPWCVVGPGVVLDADVRLLSHVVVQQDTRVGARTVIHPFSVIGGDPQHGGYKGETVRLEVGEDCLVREHSTFNRGTPVGGGLTRIGKACMFMTGAHVGHDAIVGDNVTFANHATLGGHAEIGDRVFLGGLCAVHQFGRVGQGAIIGGLAAVTRDVIPYGSAWGNHARLHGLNLIGLKRKGYDKAAVRRLLAAYRELFEGGGTFAERLDAVETGYADLPEIMEITRFIRAAGKRPLCLPGE